jgi:hypothetical protein
MPAMKFFLLLLFVTVAFSVRAQRTINVADGSVDAISPAFFNVVGGEPIVSARFTKLVSGTPYFANEWMKGNVTTKNGALFSGVHLKLDLYDNEVHYRDPKGDEMIALTPLQKITLFDTSAQLIFKFVNVEYLQTNSRVKGWYQELAEGKASAFKQIKKQMNEDKPYGSATIEQTIVTTEHYLILYNGELIEVKKFKDLPEILSDKKEQLTQYIKKNKFSSKGDSEYRSVINYYNELQ